MKKIKFRFYRFTLRVMRWWGIREPMWHKTRRVVAELGAKGFSRQEIVDAVAKFQNAIR